MDYTNIQTLEELDQALHSHSAVLVYFSHQNCNVCKVLKPKVKDLVVNNFPHITLLYVDTVKYPEVAGQYSVFTVPTILVFFDGKEYIRESRHISLSAFSERIDKLYSVYFETEE